VSESLPNNQFHRSGNNGLCRLLLPGELERYEWPLYGIDEPFIWHL
jgi:hypothetical protein